ncbi:hypothetical protein K437DRAFT_255271 [Tilletiaria anomala UBC 951]|uniref:Uncharacterized protein n=1 Tax=Tilletiaria anomala (strain ATCC 24038 / CBS 436.72 / UBC 951) TaxID=1037660 RepID=A0A066WAL2_TILAU|nr:uncharacterized protein K437DRAFT_255271 [Tilletiaria anomala UBC 951]KDN49593.1 hypothetical protein K437DRAFT_255271 [Tilletiaria anomala UBC 951]
MSPTPALFSRAPAADLNNRSKSATQSQNRRQDVPVSKASTLPYEIFFQILVLASVDQQVGPKLLSLSRDIYERLSQHVYAKVTLSSAHAIDAFASLLRSRPEFGRKVKSLWIGPTELDSDLLSALAPPESVMCRSVNLRDKVYTYTKFILRSCRKVDNLALSGGLCVPDAAFAYGTACQPKRLTCVNPHSFVGAFSAPIFNKVIELHLIDTSLAVEDGDEISKMQNLRHFIWSSPKDTSDPAQETGRIHRLVLQSLNGELPAHLMNNPFTFGSGMPDMPLSPNVANKLSTRAKNLERISLLTSQGRCVAFVRNMQPLSEMRMDLEDDGASTDSGIFLATVPASKKAQERKHDPSVTLDSRAAAATSSTKVKWILVRTCSLEPEMIEEWQALQEEVCSVRYRWDDYKPSRVTHGLLEGCNDGGNSAANGRKALRTFHTRWLAFLA